MTRKNNLETLHGYKYYSLNELYGNKYNKNSNLAYIHSHFMLFSVESFSR